MLSIVQAQAPDSLDVFRRKWAEKHPNVGDIIRDIVFAEDITSDNPGLLCFANIRGTPRQDGISVVGPAVLREEADQALPLMSALYMGPLNEVMDSRRKQAC